MNETGTTRPSRPGLNRRMSSRRCFDGSSTNNQNPNAASNNEYGGAAAWLASLGGSIRNLGSSEEIEKRRSSSTTYTEPLDVENDFHAQDYTKKFYETDLIFVLANDIERDLVTYQDTVGEFYYQYVVMRKIPFDQFWLRYFYRTMAETVSREMKFQKAAGRSINNDSFHNINVSRRSLFGGGTTSSDTNNNLISSSLHKASNHGGGCSRRSLLAKTKSNSLFTVSSRGLSSNHSSHHKRGFGSKELTDDDDSSDDDDEFGGDTIDEETPESILNLFGLRQQEYIEA